MAYQCPYGMVIVVNAAGGQYRVLRQPVPGSAGQAWRQRVARCSGDGEARAASGVPLGDGGGRRAGEGVAGPRAALGRVVTAGSALAWEETLRDGRVVVLRPLRGDDAAGVEPLWRRLDAPARRRFTSLARLPPDRPDDVAVPRPGYTAGIVATSQAVSPGRVVGVARYERWAGDTARVLVFVGASWRSAGVGTLLLRRLRPARRGAAAGRGCAQE